MNKKQKELVKEAIAQSEHLTEWQINFIDGLIELPPYYKLSEKQNNALNTILQHSTPAPDEFEITDEMIEWLEKNEIFVELAYETEMFLDHHRAIGSEFADWTAAWRIWMRKAKELSELPTERKPWH